MIKYNLICKNKHEFESWFSDSNEFERLKKNRVLECIYCNSKKIAKSIMSPSVVNQQSKNVDFISTKELKKKKKRLQNLRNLVEKNFEYVGNNFASKVREIYYNNKYKKNIYGTTTSEEREELNKEGIEFVNIPWLEKEN
ncbi:MAG: hypothetical protein CL687_03565 [Candidatus Pelagibacter sp.]|nr:hypothetical protein [Candidatus Pelagibacter sp.]|tara:strand:- start:42 stop:461 length:420 start_codon:yes stop_codon:yes gene_type:complete